MPQRLPTRTPATSHGAASGEPAAAVRMVSSSGSEKPNSASRARNAATVLSWPIVGYFVDTSDAICFEHEATEGTESQRLRNLIARLSVSSVSISYLPSRRLLPDKLIS